MTVVVTEADVEEVEKADQVVTDAAVKVEADKDAVVITGAVAQGETDNISKH
jgi:3-polyprenyl-4-hydroxybenzoate decarboxylase